MHTIPFASQWTSRFAWTSALLSLWLSAQASPSTLPIIDMHLHYGASHVKTVDVDQVFAIFERNGIRQALISSTPNDGTQALYARHPERIIPFLSFYNSLREKGIWGDDSSVIDRLERFASQGTYVGLGEFHLFAKDAKSPVLKRAIEIARDKNWMIQFHGDLEVVDAIHAIAPNAPILWAHMGTVMDIGYLERALDARPFLYLDTSVRDYLFVDETGQLNPAWRHFLMKYQDRIFIGVDTFSANRWLTFDAVMLKIRAWLGQLPLSVQRKLAYENAQKLLRSRGLATPDLP